MPIERKAIFLKSRPLRNDSCILLLVAASFLGICSIGDLAANGESKRTAVPHADGLTTRPEFAQFNPQAQAALSGSCMTPRLCGETAILTGSDTQSSDQFGSSLALDQDILVVGAERDYTGNFQSGSAYVFRWDGSEWVEEEKLVASDAAGEARFGNDVAVDGDVIVAGAFQTYLPGFGFPQGAAYVYRWNGIEWLEEAKLTAPDSSGLSRFGESVAIDNELIMVGAPDAGLDFVRASVFLFSYNNGTWVYRQQIMTPTDRYTAEFGLTGALAGDVALVGELEEYASGGHNGRAYAFRKSGSLFALEHEFDLGNGCLSWVSVATDGVLAVIGARACTGAGGNAGKAYVYRFDGFSWNLEATLIPFGVPSDYRFAEHVAMSGNRIVVSGAAGDAYLYRYEAGTWVEDGRIFSTQNLGVVYDMGLKDGTLAVAHYNSVSLFDLEADGPDCDCDETSDACEIASHIESDCNANLIPDGCDIESGTSPDCNANGAIDECDLEFGLSSDCNSNAVPDECDCASGTSFDCNVNIVPDECDIADGTSWDGNNNQIPDECDTTLAAFISAQPVSYFACEHETVVFTVVAGGMPPYTYQWRKDTVELNGETSSTLTLPDVIMTDEGDYDVVVANDLGSITSNQATLTLTMLDSIAPDPTGIAKSRFISMSIPGGGQAAIRVTFTSMHHVVPPYSSGPTIPFTAFEGQVRWVGPPVQYRESASDATTFMTARLQCQPYYQDWGTVGLLHVTGSGIVPSSTYDVRALDISCQGNEANCLVVSCSTQIKTSRWGDVASPFNPPSTTVQPNFGDVAALIDKFKSVPGALSKVRALLVGDDAFGNFSNSTMTLDFDFSQIAISLYAFKGTNYPHTIQTCP